VVAGAAIGAARALRVKGGWHERPGMYAVVVSPPGTTKTAALRTVMGPVYEAQERLWVHYQAAQRRYRADLRDCKRAPKDVYPPGALPEEPPPLRHVFVADTTVEELANNLKDSAKVILFRDELTGWVRSMDMYHGRGTDRQFFMSAWSGEM